MPIIFFQSQIKLFSIVFILEFIAGLLLYWLMTHGFENLKIENNGNEKYYKLSKLFVITYPIFFGTLSLLDLFNYLSKYYQTIILGIIITIYLIIITILFILKFVFTIFMAIYIYKFAKNTIEQDYIRNNIIIGSILLVIIFGIGGFFLNLGLSELDKELEI